MSDAESSGWRFVETLYKIMANGETPTHSEFITLGAAFGLFHYVLRRTTSSGSGKSRRMGNLLEDILTFGSMDNTGRYCHARSPSRPRCSFESRRLGRRVFQMVQTLVQRRVLWGVCVRRHTLQANWKWQEGCFDRLLRSDESLSDKWEYLSQNPVRAGLVANPDDWPFQCASTGDKL